jgi:hypothetical protein
MRSPLALALVLAPALAACSSSPDLTPMDAPLHVDLLPSAQQLIVGLWQEPGSGYVLRFGADGKQALAAFASQLDSAPIMTGTWTLPDDRHLTFTSATGLCASPVTDQVGHYFVSVTADSLIFVLDSDSCAQRATINGETFTRYTSDGG